MLLLNIQFWEGDKKIAMDLARLIADIEPVYRTDVAVLFTARFDAKHDSATIDYVSKKFKVFTYTTVRKATGWPNGPNQMMADSYGECIKISRRKQFNVQAILFVESDAVPLHKDWLNMLMAEYKACGKQVLGCWLKRGDCDVEHINGNCIMGIDFWKGPNRAILNPPSQGGWDAVLSNLLLPNGYPSKLIWSEYWLGTDRCPWKGCDYLWAPKRYRDPTHPLFGQDIFPAYLHGPKHGLGIPCVRERLLGQK